MTTQAQALYRRWRPQAFADVVGQEHITRTLQNAVSGDRLAHAYLFTGPRGTGKTSVARILAKAVNCVGDGPPPCNECAICQSMTAGRSLDLIEIDAASNTGVDDVRDLRDKISFSPNESTFKVYIIDEVHMLSTAAFNALLKTLEEPPPHAVFVLATTEPHKIPDTIASRCQRQDFRRVPVAAIVGKLQRICEVEHVEAEPAALELVARSATGSIRDAESLLDQLRASGDAVTIEHVRDILGTPAEAVVADLLDALVDADAAQGLRLVNAAMDQGVDARQFRSMILDHMRSLLLIQTGVERELLNVADDQLERLSSQATRLARPVLVAAIHRFSEARPTSDLSQPALPLELALVETVLSMEGSVAGETQANDATGKRPTTPPGGAKAARSTAAPKAAAPAGDAKANRSAAVQTPTAPAASAKAPASSAEAKAADGAADKKAAGSAAEQPTASSAADKKAAGSATDEPTTGSATDEPTTSSATDEPTASSAADEQTVSGAAGPETDGGATGPTSPGDSSELDRARTEWPAVIEAVKRTDTNTAALLRDGRPVAIDGSSLTVGFFYEFHCNKVSEVKRNELVASAASEVLGTPVKLRCTVVPAKRDDSEERPRTVADQAKQDPVVKHAVDNLGARIASVSKSRDD